MVGWIGVYSFINGKPVSGFYHHDYGRLQNQTESCRCNDLPLKGTKTLFAADKITYINCSDYKLEINRNLTHSKKQLSLSVFASGS